MTCQVKDIARYVVASLGSPDIDFSRAPDGLVNQYILDAIYDFALETGLLKDHAYVDLQCNVQQYPLLFDCKDEVVITGVSIKGCPLDERQWSRQGDTLVLDRPYGADECDGLRYDYTYAPCFECDEIPDTFCKRWRQGVVDLALSRLFAMPGQDWSDGTASLIHERKYESQLRRARSAAMGDGTNKKESLLDSRRVFI